MSCQTQLPSRWLVFALLVHGIGGGFAEILNMMMPRLATPLGAFFNASWHTHYGTWLNETELQTAFSMMSNVSSVGTIIGIFVVLPQMDRWGRRTMAVFGRAVCCAVAAVLMLMGRVWGALELFAFAKLLLGFNDPIRLGITKLYLSECSPDRFRGFFAQGASTLGQVIIMLLNVLTLPSVFGSTERWHFVPVFALGMIAVFVSLAWSLPESPKFLAFIGAPKSKVQYSLRKFHGKDVDIETIIASYEHEFHVTKSKHATISELWHDKGLRTSLYLVFLTAASSSFSSTQIYAVYSVQMKIINGFTNEQALLFDTIASLTAFPFITALPYLYERFGRRPIYLGTQLSNAIAGITILISLQIVNITGANAFTMVLSGLWSILVMFSIGFGGGLFFIILIADLLPASAKTVSTQAGLLVNSLATMATNFFYATMQPVLGPYVFLPLILMPLTSFLYCYRNLPETKRRAVHENFEEVRSRAQSLRTNLLRSRTSTRAGYGTLDQ